ncbi:hypothetical protein JW859_09455 [bacterium]|nr:hypothetical protein [bacterium]
MRCWHSGFRFVVYVMLMAGLVSCSGSSVVGIAPTAGEDTLAGEPQPHYAVAHIPVKMSPAQPIELPVRGFSQALPPALADVPYPRGVSYTEEDLTKQGSAVDQALPYSRVTFSAPPYATFDPDYTDQTGHTGLSYCMYRFALSGYDEQTTMGFTWQTPPAHTDFFVGLGNRQTDNWDWYAGEMDNVITVASFDDYLASGDILLMALMMVGTDQAALEAITIGEDEMYPLGAILPGAYTGSAPPFYASGTLPASIDLSPAMSPIRDQYPCGACTAFGFGDGAYNYILGQLYSGWDFNDDFNRVSPKHLYLCSYEGPPQPLDGGRDTDYVATYLTTGGVCTEETVPYINWYDYDFPPKAADEAALLKPDHSERIPCNTDAGILSVKEILVNQSLPVVMATLVDLGFSAIPPDDNNYVWNYTGPPVGGHCMCIAGYDDAKLAFKVRNSWSVGWGNDGYGWIGYDTFKNTAASVSCYTITDSYSAAVDQYFVGGAGNPTPPPSMVRASDGTHSEHVTITWNKAAGAGEYEIHRDFKGNIVATVGDVASYNDAVPDLFCHSYWVRGLFSGTPGDYSMPDTGYRQQGLSIVGVTPTSGNTNASTTFYVTTAGETPTSYVWNFGGGASPNTSALASPTVTLTGTPGYYSCSVTVTATSGNVKEDFTLTVNYYNEQPVASLIADPVSGLGPLLVNLDASASSDPDGNDSNLTCKWDWTNNGSYDYDSGHSAAASHEYTYTENSYVCKVLVTDEGGATDTATATIKVIPAGEVTWQRSWGNSYAEQTRAIGRTSAGRYYTLGIAALPADSTVKYFTAIASYDSGGNFEWVKRYRFADGDILPDAGWVMADGTCYACGYTNYSVESGEGDMFVVKFNADGERVCDWLGGGIHCDRAGSMYVDASGKVYLAGVTYGSFGAGNKDLLVVKLSSDLTMEWAKTWGTSADDQPWTAGNGIYVSPAGDIYVTGYSKYWDTSAGDAVLVHLASSASTDGTWAYRWSTSSQEDFSSVAADAFGNLILGGHCLHPPAQSRDWLLAKVTPDPATQSAVLVWDKLYGCSSVDWLAGVAVLDGQIFCTGYYGAGEPSYQQMLMMADYNGVMKWNQVWSGTSPCYPDALSVSPFGTLCLGGAGQNKAGVFNKGSYISSDVTGSWEKVSGTATNASLTVCVPNGTVSSASGTQDTGGGGTVDMLMLEFDPDGS